MLPSQEYMSLATTLLDSLGGGSDNVSDTVLLQLQALFGPMLTSALHLVDKRDVVRVSLPHGRYVYQITASTGKPYTLHLDLPERPIQETVPKPPTPPPDGPPDSPTLDTTNLDDIEMDKEPRGKDERGDAARAAAQARRRNQLEEEKNMIGRMYCPCPGFAYNALAGDKNVLCKHLLAALIGWKTGREIRTEVPQHGVVSLLDLHDHTEDMRADTGVKVEESG